MQKIKFSIMVIILAGLSLWSCNLPNLTDETQETSTDSEAAPPEPQDEVDVLPDEGEPNPDEEAPDEAAPVEFGSDMFTDSRPDDFYDFAAPMPDFNKIELIWLGNGYTRVEGQPGAIPGSYPVYIASPNTANNAVTRSKGDGSFSTEIIAPPGAWVLVKYDPTGGNLLHPEIINDPRPAGVNGALGALAQVPHESVDAGEGISFSIATTTFGSYLDMQIEGVMNGNFVPAGIVEINGVVNVFPDPSVLDALRNRRININAEVNPIFNQNGRPRIQIDQFFSNILTPSGFPVENWTFGHIAADGFESGELQPDESGTFLSAPVHIHFELPQDIPPGVYGVWFETHYPDEFGEVRGTRVDVNPFLANHAKMFPPFKIGNPAEPRLVWTLLTDVPSYDGSRGTISFEDRGDFQISNRIAHQSHAFIIPHTSKENGDLITYRLEPYAPMIAHGDRYVPNPSYLDFKFPSGELNVNVIRPDGSVDHLGSAPFSGVNSRTPVTSGGFTLDNGGGHLAEVFQLTTNTGMFDYQFDAYGEYIIEMSGFLEDIYGNVYQGGGTYSVFTANQLDFEPATLPMTPFEVGDAFNPGVTILPGLPADVDVHITIFAYSNPDQVTENHVSGKANRFGVFTPGPETPKIIFGEPGEFSVETTIQYTDPEGKLWMGATRWGMIVAPQEPGIMAHGRRGRDNEPVGQAKLWFFDPLEEGSDAHVQLPYASGDILWQTKNDAARVIITVQDLEGSVEASILSLSNRGLYRMDDQQRVALGELPLYSATTEWRFNPNLFPEEITVFGYFYCGVERPGERVREIVSTDDLGTGYWRFEENYHLQPGLGVGGELPNDFKFQFGGAVYRDPANDILEYAIYNTLWVLIPDEDPLETRVAPPFQGLNGGPNGGPIMVLDGQDIDAFVMPLAVRPGTGSSTPSSSS
ncbi:MAG: hypothetical protein MUO76_03290 [Anaerolineaceae bacterium]|nr:hypothetical protein [Anaerolineaceae bacterium]